MLTTIWIILGLFFSIVSFFSLLNSTHWSVRGFDFIRLQVCAILLVLLIATPFFLTASTISIIAASSILIAFIYQLSVIYPYFPNQNKLGPPIDHTIIALCVNVQQENESYERLVRLVKDVDPDIVLTMETDKKWEEQLAEIEKSYKHIIRVPKSNRYGMHLYTKLDLKEFKIHYLISEEHPSIEAELTDQKNREFIFWGIHPPPPSPTEKPTSKQKDAELMKVAELSRNKKIPIVVSGDFNNVAWSRTSKQFSKISNLTDARIKRGIYSTFPAHLHLLRFPIDLLFHSSAINVRRLKVLPSIGSDHLPLLCEFYINGREESNDKLDGELKSLVDEKVNDGKEAAQEEN